MTRLFALTAIAGTLLTACSTLPQLAPAEQISIARGACFGFCPVYELRTLPGSAVEFKGLRHTATLGSRIREVEPSVLAGLKSRLAPYKPSRGQAEFACEHARSDQATYTVRWEDSKGRVETLTFDSGCATPAGQALDAILESAADSVGFAADAKQVTRPGTSRG